MFDTKKFFHNITEITDKTKFLIAYSGGMDSHILLHNMHELCRKNPHFKIRAIHIHHGLSVNANSWVKHCTATCKRLNIELIVKKITVKKNKHSLEALARDLRYQEIAKVITADECLLTAHHADDQAETILLQLFRGCGTKGLAAMPKHKGFAQGSLVRPLLEFSREELHNYALKNKLNWIEDESNENIGHDRNFVRHKLMPIMISRWPGIKATLNRSAEHCAEADNLLNVLAQQDYAQTHGSALNTLSIKKLLNFNSARQNNLIRYWLQTLNLPTPSSIKLQHITKDVLHCRADANPIVHWHGAEVRRYRDDLYAIKPLPVSPPDIIIPWSAKTNLKLPNNLGTLKPQLLKSLGISNTKNITVRFRHEGDKCKIRNRAGTRSLKKLFQEKAIPPWQRNRTPLIFQGETLVHIFDRIALDSDSL